MLSCIIKQDKDNYTSELKDSINYLENLGCNDIRADIVAKKQGKKHIFDLSLKTVKPKLLKSKWLFFNTLSQIKSYRFRLITKRGHYKFSDKTPEAIHLSNIKVIKLKKNAIL